MADDNTPTLHHLNHSQSQRILWLLEELKIPYHLQLHSRNAPTDPKGPFLSPPSLRALGPYGTAPLLVTGANDGKRFIPESAAIATYLIRTFDESDRFGLRSGDWIRDEVLVSNGATNLNRATGMKLFLDMNAIANGTGPAGQMWDGPKMRDMLRLLQKELEEGPEGGFFMGKEPGRADILLEWPLAMISQRKWVDLESEFPSLSKWLGKCYEREAWKRGLAKGNGYDLTVFPQKPHLSYP